MSALSGGNDTGRMGMSHILRRFYLPPQKIKKKSVIEGEERHHLEDVLRLKLGDEIEIIDGEGNVYRAEIIQLDKRKASITIKEQYFVPPPSVKIHLGISLLKTKAMDLVIQKATELGVWAIYVCTTKYSVPFLKEKEKKIKRWQKLAIEALKQSGNNYLPKIKIISFEEILVQKQGIKLIAVGPREEKANPILSVFKNLQKKEVLICIGPEGGFAKEEINQAKENNFVPISLNPYILRAETATIAALSIIQNIFWRAWRDSNPRPAD